MASFRSLLARIVLSSAVLLPGAALAAFSPDQPTVLITGSNHGLGLELARQYADLGWNVIATSHRAPGDARLAELTALAAKHPNVVIERLDVTDTKGIRALAAKYQGQPIDVLLNNAAAVEPTFAADMAEVSKSWDQIDFDAAAHDFDVNTLGPMRVVQAFAPNVFLSKQKKIIAISSSAGSFSHPLPGAIGMNYGASKAALNKYFALLAVAMKPKGVLVELFQPVFVATKDDTKNMKGAAQVGPSVADLIKLIGSNGWDATGKITNFNTGKIDEF